MSSNPIIYALNQLTRFGIPKAILNIAFMSRFANNAQFLGGLGSLHDRIREEVITPRILVDCNLLHGTQITVPLVKCEKLVWNYYETVYRVPMELTAGRKVISPLELTAAAGAVLTSDGSMSATTAGMYSNNMASFSGVGANVAAARQMMNSVMPIHNVSNALLYLLGDNTILIKDSVIVPSTMHLRLVVENDANFNHIQPAWYPDFYELVLIAVQSYIYNLIVIEQDAAFIASGGELNRMRDIIEGYADAEERYKEQREHWYKCAMLNDPEGSRQHYSLSVGGLW